MFLCGYLKVGIIIFGIVFIHELGHVFFTKLFSYEIIDITIYPFGGVTRVKKDINTPFKKEVLMALGGVIAQVILFIIVSFVALSEFNKILVYKYNLSIMLFNMLPIIPLDGSIILNAILNRFFSFKKAYYMYLIISIIGIILYVLSNFWFSLNNYLIVGLFICKTYYGYKNYKYIFNKFLLERYLNKYQFHYINTSKGTLDILRIDTYQYFIDEGRIIKEEVKLRERFDK